MCVRVFGGDWSLGVLARFTLQCYNCLHTPDSSTEGYTINAQNNPLSLDRYYNKRIIENCIIKSMTPLYAHGLSIIEL